MSRASRILATSPGLLAARITGAVLQALTLLLLARLTTLEDFGAFGVTLAIGAIALGVGGLGLATRALRIGRGDVDGVGRTSLRLAAWGALAASLLAAGIGVATTGAAAAAIAAGAFILSDGISEVAQNLMFGAHRAPRAAAITVLRRVGPVVSVSVAALVAPSSTTVLWAAAIGSLISLSLVLVVLRLETTSSLTRASALIRESRPYWTNGIWAMLQQLDVVIVGALLGTRSAAAFTAAFRLASPVHIVTSLIVAQMVPAMTSALRAPTPYDGGRRHLRLALIYAGAIVLCSPVLAHIAIALLGPSFAEYWAVFVVLFVNGAASAVNQTLAARVFALHRHQRWMPWLTGTSSVIGLIAVVAGALFVGLLAAALGTLLIQALLMVSSTVVARRSLREAIQ